VGTSVPDVPIRPRPNQRCYFFSLDGFPYKGWYRAARTVKNCHIVNMDWRCEISSEFLTLVKIVIFGQNCTVCIVKRSTGRLSVDSWKVICRFWEVIWVGG
jgi:hypothetical protein